MNLQEVCYIDLMHHPYFRVRTQDKTELDMNDTKRIERAHSSLILFHFGIKSIVVRESDYLLNFLEMPAATSLINSSVWCGIPFSFYQLFLEFVLELGNGEENGFLRTF